jgi:hypothetical protein
VCLSAVLDIHVGAGGRDLGVTQTTRVEPDQHFERGGQWRATANPTAQLPPRPDQGVTSIDELLERGQTRGYVTLEEVSIVTANHSSDTAGIIEEIANQLAELSIPVVEVSESGSLVEVDVDDAEIESPQSDEERDDLSGVSLDDPVRIYLREIGRVPLLTSEQEVTLSQAMEARDHLMRVMHELTTELCDAPSGRSIATRIFQEFAGGWSVALDLYLRAFPGQPVRTRPRHRSRAIARMPRRG